MIRLQRRRQTSQPQASCRQISLPREAISDRGSGGEDDFSWWPNEAMIDVGTVAS
jgi:hypothetical protein